MSRPVNEQPASISPPPPDSSAGGDDGDDDDSEAGSDDADALSDGESEGVRNTQLVAMHSANIGIVAANRIGNLLASAMQPRCHAPTALRPARREVGVALSRRIA